MHYPDESRQLVVELSVDEQEKAGLTSSVEYLLSEAELEKQELEKFIHDTRERIGSLTPNCDKVDYLLAASSGVICGLFDIFLIGKPNESKLQRLGDAWFDDKAESFAKLNGWNPKGKKSAKKYLEEKYDVPYDVRGAGDSAASEVFGLTPSNHHFKSLAHNPTLCGLFFSILDQFDNTTHLVSYGDLMSLQKTKDGWELRGGNNTEKIFCGFINWFGHLMSDVTGSSSSKGRGMGIPSPFWAWTNDIIAIKRTLNIEASQFDKYMNELALDVYTAGFDFRYQAVQFVPVFLNEIIVRFLYSFRRLMACIVDAKGGDIHRNDVWKRCEPFHNATVKRMLTVAHGTFCAMDFGDATIRGITTQNITEFALRINIAGIGRFMISAVGEGSRHIAIHKKEQALYELELKKGVVDYYVSGLRELCRLYDDSELLKFTDEILSSELYESAFEKSIEFARLRKVPEEKILHNKKEIDDYFMGER